MADESKRERDKDMVLAPNESMYVIDQTKGHVDVYVGPTKQSLSNTDQPVVFDATEKRFREVSAAEAKQLMQTAPEGWYIVLKNPAVSGNHPTGNGKLSSEKLEVGKKVNVPGPVSFCLWPGQMAKVIRGHQLRSNQYLLGRVYDEAAARENWRQAVVKKAPVSSSPTSQETGQTQGQATGQAQSQPQEQTVSDIASVTGASVLTMGQLIIIKGTDVSFFIPPTGIEIVPDEDGDLVRDAVTLERLEYCLLQDEDGNKRYERGPAVVFPRPTEVFATDGEDGGSRKFRAIELNENSGIYVKVIADYEDDDYENPGEARKYKVGEELFITGKHQMIYFPREEHAIVTYDGKQIHYGITIPVGEAKYVMDRINGPIELVHGPKVLLPDPRAQVIVRRVLDYKTCSLLYPDNRAALEHNARISGVDMDTYMSRPEVAAAAAAGIALNYSADMDLSRGVEIAAFAPSGMRGYAASVGSSAQSRGLTRAKESSFSGTSIERKTKFSEPRTLTLSTKYDGAVMSSIFTGYAMMLVRKNGNRRVVQGPATVLLEYDETPEVLELSTGKPKTTDKLFRTVFLRTKANVITDVVVVTTKDFCDVELKLSYRMDFTGPKEKWFEVENYVKYMCDRIRSKMKAEARKHVVEDFFAQSTEISRKVVLGPEEKGMLFQENGMHVYEVEVLAVIIKTEQIQKSIVESQMSVIKTSLELEAKRRSLQILTESEEITRKTVETKAETERMGLETQSILSAKRHEIAMKQVEDAAAIESEKAGLALGVEEARSKVHAMVREQQLKDAEALAVVEKLKQAAQLELTEAETAAAVERFKAISPDIVVALQAFSDRALAESAVRAIGPMSIFGGESVSDILSKIFKGIPQAGNLLKSAEAISSATAHQNGTQVRS